MSGPEKFSTDAPPEVAYLNAQQAWAYGYSMGEKAAFSRARMMVDELFPPNRELSPEVSDDEG